MKGLHKFGIHGGLHHPSYVTGQRIIFQNLLYVYWRLFDFLLSWQLTSALSHAGLESPNLIVGIDVTKSNEWTCNRVRQGRDHLVGIACITLEQLQTLISKLFPSLERLYQFKMKD
ncbi:Copine (Calcium-dependent phospholipid-binding protein) family [Raphanus sativus]|nr:Copine (Calcium-dependent phospholipid-binding protein) family [Raphanus sativus]